MNIPGALTFGFCFLSLLLFTAELGTTKSPSWLIFFAFGCAFNLFGALICLP